MSIVDSQMEDNPNVISFEQEKAKRAGGTPPPGVDWLSRLEIGTVFRVKQKRLSNIELIDYQLTWKGQRSVVVYCAKTNHKYPIDPIVFCEEAELFEILGIEKGVDD
jgi:hypothetical protein